MNDIQYKDSEVNAILPKLRSLKTLFSEKRHIPLCTYRLQFNKAFTFSNAVSNISYLEELGITHCYASPYLSATPGSTHGYDICDYNQISPEIGGETGYESWIAELSRHGMSHILDFVPNHMGISSHKNIWWHDVLENGKCSPFADFFDIEWQPVKLELEDKILLPILGDQYGIVLERGEIILSIENGAFFLNYYDRRLPINPRFVPMVLSHDLELLQSTSPENSSDLMELLSVITELNNLPTRLETDPERIRERTREKEIARVRLKRLMEESPIIRQHIEKNIRVFNGDPGNPQSFDSLDKLLKEQSYRLAYWRTAGHEINYRRFFDINELAGIQMEKPKVFDAAHSLILRLIREGKIEGLRLDHSDGLYDPMNYFQRLQQAVLSERVLQEGSITVNNQEEYMQAIKSWREEEFEIDRLGAIYKPIYLVVEKILSGTEILNDTWPVHGTSGYDFMNELNGIFINTANEHKFNKIYSQFIKVDTSFADIIYEAKKLIMNTSMSSELNMLAHILNRISEENRHTRDFTLNSLREAIMEIVACFPTYRIYVDSCGATSGDRETLVNAISRARQRNPTMEPTILNFIHKIILADECDYGIALQKQLDFSMRFQQYTGPVHAKGVEDTAFYRYNRFVSLNEVGGQPQRFGIAVSVFHDRNLKRQINWPATMLASGTHDHKRGEDVRARLNILSEMPDEWEKAVKKWTFLNRDKVIIKEGQRMPDYNDEYLFYQTLIGIWPFKPLEEIDMSELCSRLESYMLKAVKEAKTHSSWVNSNEDYENSLKEFINGVLRHGRFLNSFIRFEEPVSAMGILNSLSQVLVKLTVPGVPDVYQGAELWDLSLVDPDNRRPVDFELRKNIFGKIRHLLLLPAQDELPRRAEELGELLYNAGDGRIKMYITACALRHRNQFSDLFLKGEYYPLKIEGELDAHIIAFARHWRGQTSISVVPRFVVKLIDKDLKPSLGKRKWLDTRIIIPGNLLVNSSFTNLFTGEIVSLNVKECETVIYISDIFSTFPLALLTNNIST